MSKVYFDPDTDELVLTKKLSPEQKAALRKLLDDDDAREKEKPRERMDGIEHAIRENTEALRMNTMAVVQHSYDAKDALATAAGFAIGYNFAAGGSDSDSLFSFLSSDSKCKKKWF